MKSFIFLLCVFAAALLPLCCVLQGTEAVVKISLPPGSAPSHRYPFSAIQVWQPRQDSPVFSPSHGLRRSTSVPCKHQCPSASSQQRACRRALVPSCRAAPRGGVPQPSARSEAGPGQGINTRGWALLSWTCLSLGERERKDWCFLTQGGQSQPGCSLRWSVLVSQAPSSKCALGMSPDLRHKHGTAELGGVGGSSDMDQGTFTSWSGWRLQRHLFICITAQVITSLHQHRWMGQQPRGASSGKTKRSYLHPALKHGHAERCVWFLAVCGAQGCAGGIPWSFRWVR